MVGARGAPSPQARDGLACTCVAAHDLPMVIGSATGSIMLWYWGGAPALQQREQQQREQQQQEQQEHEQGGPPAVTLRVR